MKILYIHQHFAIPSGSTGTRSYEFAKRWVKAGHQVTVITGHYDIGGLEYSHAPQFVDGINIVIAGTKYSNKQSPSRRVLSFLGFMYCAFIAGLKQKRVDVIYATSTPLTVGVPAMLLKWFKRIPFVFEVRDQWPEIPIALGYIKNPFLKHILLYLEKRIYLSSSAIVALSPGMAAGINNVLSNKAKTITVVSNCSDIDVSTPDVDGEYIRKIHGWKKTVVFLHAGAMGKVNGLHFIIDAAEKLKDNKNILFVLLGEGNEKPSLERRIAQLNLDNVQILPSVPKHALPKVFAAADIGLVIIGNYPIIQHNSANKFFDSLSAGKPVLLNYSGWQREILQKANAGLGCELCNIDEFVLNVLELSRDNQLRKIMGSNARQLAETQFNRETLAERVRKVLEAVI